MVSEMKRIAVVVLLSIALVLVSGQAEAKAVTSKLSGKLQSSLGQVLKVLESDGAVSVTLYGAFSCATIGIFASLFDPTVSQFFFDAARIGVYTMPLPFGLNIRRLEREVEERDEELDQLQEMLDQLQEIIDNIEIEEINREQKVSKELKLESQLKLENLTEYVEVNDSDELSMRLVVGFADLLPDADDAPNAADPLTLLVRTLVLVEENGGFPLVVTRDGLTFNNGVFASYVKMFGDLAFRMQEETEIEEN